MVDFLGREENARHSRRLHHLALGSADVARLARFYCEVLGLPEHTRHYTAHGALRSVWLELAGTLLMIEHSEAIATRVEGVGAGFFLIALAIDASERDALEAQLAAHGVVIESRTEWTSYARDPDGNRIAFSAYPSERALTGAQKSP